MESGGGLMRGGYLVEELKQLGAGLVDGANDGPSPLRQSLQQGEHLEAGGAVQATGGQGLGQFTPPSQSHVTQLTVHPESIHSASLFPHFVLLQPYSKID